VHGRLCPARQPVLLAVLPVIPVVLCRVGTVVLLFRAGSPHTSGSSSSGRAGKKNAAKKMKEL